MSVSENVSLQKSFTQVGNQIMLADDCLPACSPSVGSVFVLLLADSLLYFIFLADVTDKRISWLPHQTISSPTPISSQSITGPSKKSIPMFFAHTVDHSRCPQEITHAGLDA